MTNIKLIDILFNSKNVDYEKVVFSYKTKELIKPCDIGIVFGGTSMIPNRVELALKLYKQNLIKKILVSGKNPYFVYKKSEAERMCEYLINHGIPKEDIIIENKSRSTILNIKHSLNLLKNNRNFKSLSYVLITSQFHAKRCLALFTYILGTKKNVYVVSAKDSLTDVNNWSATKYGKRIIKRAALLIWYYSKKGVCFK